MKKLIAALFVLFLLGVGTVAAGAYYWWNTPAEPSTREINYEVSEGSTLGTVASDLEKLGALRWAPLLRLYARYTGQGNRIKAGDYLFDTHSLPREILAKLVRGEVQTIQFVIPEGYNRFQIAEKLAQTFPQISKETWLAEMNGRKYAAALPAGIQNLEGFLYPETYTIRPKATASEVLFAMVNMFSKHFTEEVTLAGKKLGLEPLQIVTLASIIEKETGRAEERPRISSVFHNRLNKKMRLQTDPTVIYGMWEKYDGNIRKKDLQAPSPYNTYLIDALPPGPIANPGKGALRAAVAPASTNDLYFVGKGDGSHFFSTNLSEHNKAVFEYQIKPFRKAQAKDTK